MKFTLARAFFGRNPVMTYGQSSGATETLTLRQVIRQRRLAEAAQK